MSIEQMVRDLLERAVKDRLVREADSDAWFSADGHPQARTSGDLAGVANMLGDFLRKAVATERAACIHIIESAAVPDEDDDSSGITNARAHLVACVRARGG